MEIAELEKLSFPELRRRQRSVSRKIKRLLEIWDRMRDPITEARHRHFVWESNNIVDAIVNKERQQEYEWSKATFEISESEEFPMGYLKIGRTCVSCKHSSPAAGEFYRCKLRERHGKPLVWGYARCLHWVLTADQKRLEHMERYTDTKVRKFRQMRTWLYSRYTSLPQYLFRSELGCGRCCLFCEHRRAKKRAKIVCHEREGELVWARGVCHKFVMNESPNGVRRFRKYLIRSGDAGRRASWWKLPTVMPKGNSAAFKAWYNLVYRKDRVTKTQRNEMRFG